MKRVQKIFILSGIISVAALGVGVYFMFWGPDAVQISGRSLSELWESGEIAPFIIVPLVLIITAVSMIPFLRIIFPAEIKDGVTTQARVLKVWDTGVTVNDNPQVGLLLEYSPVGSGPIQVESKTLVSRLNSGLVQAGATAEIKYDPQKPQRLQVLSLNVESPGTESAPAADTVARMEQLNTLREKGLISEEEYRRKREDILRSL